MQRKTLTNLAITSILTTCITMTSVQAARPGQGQNQGATNNASIQDIVNRIFTRLDSDENGTISLDEFTGPTQTKAEEKFAHLDSDDDQQLTLEEIKAARTTPPGDDEKKQAMRQCIAEKLGIELPPQLTVEERFALADTDGNGVLDLTEYVASKVAKATTKFNHIDSNSDGELNQGEVTSAVASRKDKRAARKACREELQAIEDLLED